MKTNKLKYTIVYRSKENIWGKFNHQLKFTSQKWSKFLSKLDRKKPNFLKDRRPRSLRVLSRHRLMTKQKFKSFYGHLSYAVLKKEYRAVKKMTSFNRVDHLIILLERRLDVFLFRSGLFASIFEAKQAIKHNKIQVNNKVVSNSNYKMNKGDFITIPQELSTCPLRNLPYSQINSFLSLIVFLRNPQMNEIQYPFRLSLKLLTGYLNKK